MGMLSPLARSPMGRELIEFMEVAGINPDWDETGVTAFVTGNVLDNQNVHTVTTANGIPNNEMLVHLTSKDGHTCVVNVNTLLALAAAFIREQFAKADDVLQVANRLRP